MYRISFVGVMCAVLIPATTHAFSTSAIERAIGLVFPNEPRMVEIARCESGLRQNTSSGSVLRGGLGSMMIGLFQLHEKYHRAPAQAMGLDIDTLVGNLLYTRSLYRAQGLTPWRSSAHCWDTDTTVQTAQSTNTLTKTLHFGTYGTQVGILQARLAELGYLTQKYAEQRFDVPTYLALIQFQCDKDIACLTKPENRAGIGTTNAQTRAVLNNV